MSPEVMHPELIEGDLLQQELYNKYDNEKNERKKLYIALELQDYNHDIGFVDADLCAYISEALHGCSSYTYRDLASPQKLTYEAWYDLIRPDAKLEPRHLIDNLEALKAQPYLKSREEIIIKTRLAIVEAFKEQGNTVSASTYLQKIKSSLEKSKNKNLQKYISKIADMEAQLS